MEGRPEGNFGFYSCSLRKFWSRRIGVKIKLDEVDAFIQLFQSEIQAGSEKWRIFGSPVNFAAAPPGATGGDSTARSIF